MQSSRKTIALRVMQHPAGGGRARTYTAFDPISRVRRYTDYITLKEGEEWEEAEAAMLERIAQECGLESVDDIIREKAVDPVAAKLRAMRKPAKIKSHLTVVRNS